MTFDSVYLASISGNVCRCRRGKKGPPVEIESRKREEIIFVSLALPPRCRKPRLNARRILFSAAGNPRDMNVKTRVSKCSDRSSQFSYRGLGDKKISLKRRFDCLGWRNCHKKIEKNVKLFIATFRDNIVTDTCFFSIRYLF